MKVSIERRREVEGKARQLLQHVGITAPPVGVEAVARAAGVAVRYAPFDEELSGSAFIKDGHQVIAVNALHHPNRQRFTIAHELGHHVLHRSRLEGKVHLDKAILNRDALAASGEDTDEIEANIFAAELLMPREMFTSIVGPNLDLHDEEWLISLARRFKVSLAALQLRIANLA